MDRAVAPWIRGQVWGTELSTRQDGPGWRWKVTNGNRIVAFGEEFTFASAFSVCRIATVASRYYWMFALTMPKALKE